MLCVDYARKQALREALLRYIGDVGTANFLGNLKQHDASAADALQYFKQLMNQVPTHTVVRAVFARL